MTYAGAIIVILTHLTAAGATLTPAIVRVRQGEPASAPGMNMLAVWYDGTDESDLIGTTFTDVSYDERLMVGGFFPVNNDDDTLVADMDDLIHAAVRAITNRLHGDAQLGGNCADLKIGSAQVVWLEYSGALYRAFELPVRTTFSEVDEIAP